MEKTKTLSLCMIVKNEEKSLRQCLNSIKDLVDEFIIVDTGSTDNTINIIKDFSNEVYFYKWDDNFSNARNYSLSKATKDWVLLMDADDILENEDKDKIINLINTSKKDGHFFKTLSYVSDGNTTDYVYNLNLRLLRNTGEYEFKGAIHEQITHKFEVTDFSKFNSNDIRIYHTGYLPSTSESKNKRNRNISILEEELKKYPNSAFHNFNIGNEYLALNDLNKALEFYEKAYKNMNINSGYATKLVFRRILCFIEKNDFDKALLELDNGLNLFPKFTELQFYKGYCYHRTKRFTLAIESYEKSLKMGPSPIEYSLLNGCGSFRDCVALGDIYLYLKDYDKALDYFLKSLNMNKSNTNALYKLGKTLRKIFKDDKQYSYELSKHFNLNSFKDLILIASILIEESTYDYALGYIEKASDLQTSDLTYFLMGKTLFYLNNYDKSFQAFLKIPKESIYYDESLEFLLLIKLVLKKSISEEEFTMIKDNNSKDILKQLYCLSNNIDINPLEDHSDNNTLNKLISILNHILKAKEFSLFESYLPILNLLNNNNILIELSKIYYNNGYASLAIEEAIRSIKVLDAMDEEILSILYMEI